MAEHLFSLAIYSSVRFGIAGKAVALNSEDREKEVTFEANEVGSVVLCMYAREWSMSSMSLFLS